MKYNIASFFAGVGGICLGFKRASKKYNLVVSNEMNKSSIITYRENFNHRLVTGDIEKILHPLIFLEEFNFLKIKYENNQLTNYDTTYIQNFCKHSKQYLEKTYANRNKQNYENPEIELDIVKYLYDTTDLDNVMNQVTKYSFKQHDLIDKRIDILIGGFPCQAFSIAGEQKGFNDYRGNLFYSFLDYIQLLDRVGHGKPRIVFMENVKHLVNHNSKSTFTSIINELESFGYMVKYKIMNTSEYTNIPQNRERVFIIAFLNETDYKSFDFNNIHPKKIDNETKRINYENVINFNGVEDKYYYTPDKYPRYFSSEMNLKDFVNANPNSFYQIRRGMYFRASKEYVCPTLTANMGTGGHNVPLIQDKRGIRKLTPQECFDLQGFRVSSGEYKLPPISDSDLYKQAGNAVTVDLIELIAKELLQTLESN